MAPMEEFETNLKDVVTAKRLSASKMTALTELAMKNMDHDTQLVSILYRTHKSLPSSASKISSLYIFDALSRAAKSYATKHNLPADVYSQPGNAATFLQKVGGVVEGLFHDMVATGSTEAKEKTKKILDIWVKGTTFPTTILSQLSDILNGTNKEPDTKNLATTDPRVIVTPPTFSPPVPVQTPTVQALDPQATLLALLTQAAANTPVMSIPQAAPNFGTAPQLDAAQLAVLQQLAHTAASVPSVPQFLPPPESVNVQNFPSSGVNGSSLSPPSHRDEPRTMVRTEQRYSGYRSPENESRAKPHFDDRDNMRGRYRGGFRNRGRGDRLGRNWDDRDRDQYQDSERGGRSPPRSFRGRSRSRSPPRNGDRSGSRFISPQRRPRGASPPIRQQQELSVRRETEPGKDEFGRDIRPESPKSPVASRSPPPPLIPSPRSKPAIVLQSPPPDADKRPEPESLPLLITPNSKTSSSTNTAPTTDPSSIQAGMESFNLAAFDYTSPASWEALGKMWMVSNGYMPSTEQLMQFVVSCGTGQQVPMGSNIQLSNQEFPQHTYASRGRGRGRGFLRGRGSAYSNGRNLHDDMDYADGEQATDAIVLGRGDGVNGEPYAPVVNNGQGPASPEAQTLSGPVSSGRMQRVGDKWVFVRGAAMDVS